MKPGFVSRQLLVDLVIGALLLAGSGVWATRFWNAWTSGGGEPSFYQTYFEPAVMIACGKGFVIAQPSAPPAVQDFLARRRDALSCSDLPADMQVGKNGMYQGAWIYLQTTVGWAWRILGISWSGMGPLFGMFFGIVIAQVYAICRLGMGRVAAAACALGLATSYIHLTNLPHLRDYAKAPFTLALVLILGVLVTTPVRRGLLLGLALIYGLVLGIGYGFRTDFLVNVPLFAFVVFAFLDGGLTKNLALKAAATAVFFVTFLIVSWPATSTVYKQGGCQWHVAMLGLYSPFDEYLRVAPAPYEFGYAYSDGYMAQSIEGYATRMNPSSAPLQFCSHEYDVQSGRMLRAIVESFPGDVMTRAYGAVLQIAELPFESWGTPLANWHTTLYQWREAVFRPSIGSGVFIVAGALVLAGAISLRLGLFLLFFVAYFGGYPAIQFQQRHHFHLEFMTWWAGGFLAHQTVAALWAMRQRRPSVDAIVPGLRRAAIFATASALFVVSVLTAARWYQHRQAVALLESYIDAPKTALDPATGVLPAVAPRAWPQMLEVDLDQAKCGANPAVRFRYAAGVHNSDLSRTVTIARRSRAAGVTRIFQPVYVNYDGLEYSNAAGCVTGVYQLGALDRFHVLLDATLPPGWQSAGLHQRLAEWERDPLIPPMTPMPALTTWTTITGENVTVGLLGSATVVGDKTTAGYQLTSPKIDAPVGARVYARLPISASRGKICVGVLNATTEKWLIAAVPPRREFSFVVDDTAGFMLAVSNCNPFETAMPTRFRIWPASYAVE